MDPLPHFILEEVFCYLDLASIHTLCLVSLDFYIAARPSLFYTLRLKNCLDKQYISFLEKNGKWVRKLETNEKVMSKFLMNHLHISELLPCLRTVCLSNYGCKPSQEVSNDLQNLHSLKALTLKGCQSIAIFKPIITKLDFLHIDAHPGPLATNPDEYAGLKTLSTNSPRGAWASQHPYRILLKENGLAITNTHAWVETFSNNALYLLRLPSNLNLKAHENVEEQFPNYYYINKPTNHILSKVQHCKVQLHTSDHPINYFLIRTFPSIEVEQAQHAKPRHLGQSKLLATNLSLKVSDHQFQQFFRWALQCFPNLKHLYVTNRADPNLLQPLPTLTHFYSSVPQSPEFWKSLALAAPNLTAIFTKVSPTNNLNLLPNHIQIFPYQTIYNQSS
ncbi:hypothetical protein DSO57_1017902 [Entomophthora muscae]|uniref:Uncharacterized protein n=1 Tax=Entomophthora muscae TaxID=34485 RepID=A0ACC2RJB0_9FUNG|nr:hypothetical protein DSO57_1017902 [Entomophthora muscae]